MGEIRDPLLFSEANHTLALDGILISFNSQVCALHEWFASINAALYLYCETIEGSPPPHPPDNILTPLDKILRKKTNMTSSPFLPEAVDISLEG